jgi:histidine ammonia-lyase
MAAAQALDFREHGKGKGVEAARRAIRKVVLHLDEDRPLFPDHNAMAALVERCDVLDAVHAEVGPLGASW